MTVDIDGIERLTSWSEKRVATALNKASTGVAVLDAKGNRKPNGSSSAPILNRNGEKIPSRREARDNFNREQYARQEETLTVEVEHIIANKIAREKLDSFEVKKVVVNKEDVVKGYIHDLASNPEALDNAKTVRNLAKKQYITLLSVPISEYEEGSERITELFATKQWVVALKMPGSINNYHLASPVDFKTFKQRMVMVGTKQEQKRARAERKQLQKTHLQEIRQADAEYRKRLPEIRAEERAVRDAERAEKTMQRAEEKTRLDALKRAKKKAKRDFNIRNKEALTRKKAMKRQQG